VNISQTPRRFTASSQGYVRHYWFAHGPVLAARVHTCSKMASDIHNQISVASQGTAAPECTTVVRVARLQARYLLDCPSWPFQLDICLTAHPGLLSWLCGREAPRDAGWRNAAMHETRNSGYCSARTSLNAPAAVESVEVDLSGQ
jgi:hypothetical protein